MIIWRNLIIQNSTIYSLFREPSKELAEPMGTAEPGLKNTDVASSVSPIDKYNIRTNQQRSESR